jgi:hypothetical protein
VAYRHKVLTSCSRKVALICGLLLLAVGQAWSAGAPSAPQSRPASTARHSSMRNKGMARPWFFYSRLLHGLPGLGCATPGHRAALLLRRSQLAVSRDRPMAG